MHAKLGTAKQRRVKHNDAKKSTAMLGEDCLNRWEGSLLHQEDRARCATFRHKEARRVDYLIVSGIKPQGRQEVMPNFEDIPRWP